MPAPGPDKALCGAQRSNQPEGATCRQVAGYRTTHPGVGHCYRHGGCTPTQVRGAQIEIARRECDRLGVPIDTDPGDALIGLVREAAGNVEFYRSLVADLPTHPERLTNDEGESRTRTGVYGPTFHQSGIPTGEAKPHVLVVLYNEERDRLAAFAQAALKAGVEERRIRLAEADAQKLMAGVVVGLQRAKVSPEQAEEFRRGFAEYLRQHELAGVAG